MACCVLIAILFRWLVRRIAGQKPVSIADLALENERRRRAAQVRVAPITTESQG